MKNDKRMGRPSDACPLPPGAEPMEEDMRSRLLNFYDKFFGNRKVVASILTTAIIVLAYGLLSVPPPLATPVTVPETWNRSLTHPRPTGLIELEWTPRFERQTVHDGDLILKGDDVLLIENSTYILNGVLLVRDRAKLILRNAELYVQEKTSWTPADLLPFFIHAMFNNSATLEAYNSSIYYPSSRLDVGFFQNSRALIESSDFTRTVIWGDEESTIKICNSNIRGLGIARDAQCEVIGSEVLSISGPFVRTLYLLGPERQNQFWGEGRVEVRNSTIHHVIIQLRNFTAASVSSPIKGFHRFWNTYKDLSVEGLVFNLTLHDTNVTGTLSLSAFSGGSLKILNRNDVMSIGIEDGSLQVSNSSLLVLGCGKGSTVEVEDSIFGWLHFENDAKIGLARSKADLLIIDGFKGAAFFDNFLVNEIWLDDSEAYIGGSIKFGENATLEVYWEKGAITRNFEVRTHRGRRVLPGVKLTLYDKEGAPVWSGETGKDGKAYFNITFCKLWPLYEPFKYVTNYEDLWRLEASKGETSYNASVGLFQTDTPIVFAFPSEPEPPFWARGWFLSAVSATVIILVMGGYLLARRLR